MEQQTRLLEKTNMKILPTYPVYIPSKGRYDCCYTAQMLDANDVPFYLVVEKEEEKKYAENYGNDRILVLPFSNQGSVIPSRNWIKKHATENGYKRHWQLDDNITEMYRLFKGKRIRCDAGIALRVCEDFTERYTNIAISGLNYTMFAIAPSIGPFFLNVHVYSCCLILNSLTQKWRGKYNEDTDLCLQVLADGWCTVLLNAFLANKMRTMVMSGGNTTEIYDGDGRLKMARSLERVWKGVVTTERRFERPQHVIKNCWKNFDTPLIRREDIDWDNMELNEYGMQLKQITPKINSKSLRKLIQNRLD